MTRSWSGLVSLGLCAALGGCGNGPVTGPDVAPVEAALLCDRVAEIVCTSDRSCCDPVVASDPDGDGADAPSCVETQVETCRGALGALIDDPRLAYNAVSAGRFVETLRTAASGCWAEPLAYADFAAIFDGTGVEGADCTPAAITRGDLRLSTLSCEQGTACRLYLRSDGSPMGVCEAREDRSCSHALDCPADEFCNLPADWTPGMWGQCQPLRTDGWPCGGDLECASQYCSRAGVCATPRPERYCLHDTYRAAVLDDAPIGYWRLDDPIGGVALDASGNDHEGAYVGNPGFLEEGAVVTDVDGATELDGDEDHVLVPSLPEMIAADGLTLECWFNPADITSPHPILELSDGMNLGPHVWSFDQGDKVFVNLVDADGGSHTVMSEPGVVAAGEWHHIAATYDGEVGRLYLDGERIGEVAGSFRLRTDGDLYVGMRPTDGRMFVGGIDEVAVYDHALGAGRIRHHHEVGASGPTDKTFPLYRWVR